METAHYFKYSTVEGFFQQDDPATDGKTFDYSKTNLGLIDRKYITDDRYDGNHKKTQWQRFDYFLTSLNEQAAPDVQYKLLYLGRHGEGDHNVAEAQYGTEAWDCHWSKLEGDGKLHWADAHVTAKGEAQALVAHQFWRQSLTLESIPAPQSYYASPMDRCLATANLTFSGLELPRDRPFKPIIKELVRETLGVHTCDRRSPRSAIAARWPAFKFEQGFTENDTLWLADLRESDSQLDHRVKTLLDDVFAHDSHTYLSLTSHSGAIGGFLRVLGHIPFSLQTGGVIPVLVKVQKISGRPPPTKIEPGIPAPTCVSESLPNSDG